MCCMSHPLLPEVADVLRLIENTKNSYKTPKFLTYTNTSLASSTVSGLWAAVLKARGWQGLKAQV